MPPCTTFSRQLVNPFEQITPCQPFVNNNAFLLPSSPAPAEESVDAGNNEVLPAEDKEIPVIDEKNLVAEADGLVVKIFDKYKQPLLYNRRECSHTNMVVSPLMSEIRRIVEKNGKASPMHVCLMCQKTFVGEKSRSDMEDHFEVSGHSITMCVDDLSFWCFECDHSLDKTDSLKLNSFHSGVEQLKWEEAVKPKSDYLQTSLSMDCNHLENLAKPESFKSVGLKSSCNVAGCSHDEDNFVCLVCTNVFCGKLGAKHIADHKMHNKSHNVFLRLSDLSIWCDGCQVSVDYRTSASLYDIYTVFYEKKYQVDITKQIEPAYVDLNEGQTGLKRKTSLDSFLDLENLLKKQKLEHEYASSESGASIESWDPKFNFDLFANTAEEKKRANRQKIDAMYDIMLANI